MAMNSWKIIANSLILSRSNRKGNDMRIDPKSAAHYAANKRHTVRDGSVVAFLQGGGTLYLHNGSAKEALGSGTYVRAKVAPGSEISADVAYSVRDAKAGALSPADGGEVFTNFDKRPDVSSLQAFFREQMLRQKRRATSDAIARAREDRRAMRIHGLEVAEDRQPPAEPIENGQIIPDPPDPETRDPGTTPPAAQ
jgi:hypothetical protein